MRTGPLLLCAAGGSVADRDEFLLMGRMLGELAACVTYLLGVEEQRLQQAAVAARGAGDSARAELLEAEGLRGKQARARLAETERQFGSAER